MRLQILLPLASLLLVTDLIAGNEQQLRLVPFPKSAQLNPGKFSLAQPSVLRGPAESIESLNQLLREELRPSGFTVEREADDSLAGQFEFRWSDRAIAEKIPSPPDKGSQAYRLEVRTNAIVCSARSAAGLIYGMHTLRQLIRANREGTSIPCLTVEDWPSLTWRCFQDDMTRGPSSTLDALKKEASLGAYLKFNLMTYYMEHQFAFKKHPKIGPANGSLTPEDLTALVKFAKQLHLDILGNQQSFGHFGHILKHPEYAHLRETPDVLTPAKEETYQLLDDLYSEVAPLLPFPWFNVCCDETWGLGTGPSKPLAEKIGVGGVYAAHIRRVHDLLKEEHQKRMMMWGDIILQHPERLSDIPKDTIMLTWGYDARNNFENQIVPFARSGYEFFVCPGVNNWSRILPDFGVAVTNIQHFVRDGAKHGALGMINTDWEDDGEALNAVKWHADAWAAECAWNASATDFEDFNRRVGGVLFGESRENFGEAIALLAQTHRLPAMKGMFNARFWEEDFFPKSNAKKTAAAAAELLNRVQPAIRLLETARKEALWNEPILDTMLFGARRMELIGTRMQDGLESAQLYSELYDRSREAPGEARPSLKKNLERIQSLIVKNRDLHKELGEKFAALWLSQSKPHGLDWTLNRYAAAVRKYDGLLEHLAKVQAALDSDQSLPSPEELGFALPKPWSRATPSERRSELLSPASSWAAPGASHRLGLVINPGAADRYDVPVEVELELPGEWGSSQTRAFLLKESGPVELLSQLAPVKGRKSRLLLLLPGALLKGAEAHVHLYFGTSLTKSERRSAVSTRPSDHENHWLENDRVRLLLGREGAHLYRWEVKEGNKDQGGSEFRDLTMPGETDWAGFSDMSSERQTAFELQCVSRGPAMVEFECISPTGFTKTIRLYAGMSWVEVFLDEPTGVYWDFDAPKNFAADGPTPGIWLFSNGETGAVGRESDGVPAQVKARDVFWGVKYSPEKLALGLITPEVAAYHHVAPGAGAGGVGIEGSSPAMHFVTFAGHLEQSPKETMERLRQSLDLRNPVSVRVHALQKNGR